MIEFVGLAPFLGESHYGLPWKPCILNLAITDLFYDNFISHSWCTNNNLAPIRNCPGCNVT